MKMKIIGSPTSIQILIKNKKNTLYGLVYSQKRSHNTQKCPDS